MMDKELLIYFMQRDGTIILLNIFLAWSNFFVSDNMDCFACIFNNRIYRIEENE